MLEDSARREEPPTEPGFGEIEPLFDEPEYDRLNNPIDWWFVGAMVAVAAMPVITILAAWWRFG